MKLNFDKTVANKTPFHLNNFFPFFGEVEFEVEDSSVNVIWNELAVHQCLKWCRTRFCEFDENSENICFESKTFGIM